MCGGSEVRPDLSGRTAVVTGAGAGIGAGIAASLAAAGARVFVNDIDPVAAASTVALIEESGASAVAIAADVADPSGVAAMVATAGEVDILVNNAGIGHSPTPVGELDLADVERRWRVNVLGMLLACREVVAPMRRAGGGRVVNIGSRAWLGTVGYADYSATKGGVVSLTRSLALELGPEAITVNAVIPGSIVTPAFEAMPAEARAEVMARHPAGRFGEPADVGRAVVFLAAPAARAITGQLLHVCGGRSLYGGPVV